MDLILLRQPCPVCHRALRPGHAPWHFVCAQCRYEQADLRPAINSSERHALIDEPARQAALMDLRVSNFQRIIQKLQQLRPHGARMLEVGCAHGWFLDLASSSFTLLGLEPDQEIHQAADYRGYPVRLASFPEGLGADERFDIIVFNDVIEHIPDIEHTIAACKQHLHPGGLLALNLPSSRGIFYRVSKMMARWGFPGPFQRMWQFGLPSPHVHYLDPQNLATLLEHQGFVLQYRAALPALRLRGLWKRLTYTGAHSLPAALVGFVAICLAYPVLRLLPADIVFAVAERK